MQNMDLVIDEMLGNPPLKKNPSEAVLQEKVIIRIKKQEQDVDIEGSSPNHQEEIVSYTCEFVQKVDEAKSELDDSCDESIDSVRQDENFIYPAVTNSDDEDVKDVTWQPPPTVMTPRERMTRKHIKCLYPKVEKKRKCKNSEEDEEFTVKNLKKKRFTKKKQVLDDTTDIIKPVDVTGESLTKKSCDSLPHKVYKPRKGMATPKQRLGRIIKIHKMMK